jgi:hypothetical protein
VSKDWIDSPHGPPLASLRPSLRLQFLAILLSHSSPFSPHDVLPLRIRYHIDWDKQSLPDTVTITPFHPFPSLHSLPGFQFDTSDILTRAGHYFCSFFSSKIVLSIHQIHYCLRTVSCGTPQWTVQDRENTEDMRKDTEDRIGMSTRHGCLMGYVCNSRNKLFDLLADF